MNLQQLKALLIAAMPRLAGARDELRALDAAIGDGDLGITVGDGAAAVQAALAAEEPATVAAVLRTAARAFAKANPSTMSALTAAGLLAAARELGEDETLDRRAAVRLLDTAAAAIAARGGAEPGDKTILDAVQPSLEALHAAPPGSREALRAMIDAAQAGVDRTRASLSRRGRAAWVGERSAGHADGGATAYVRFLESLAQSWPQASPLPSLPNYLLKEAPVLQRPNPALDTPAPWLGVNFWSRRGGPLMWRTYDDALVREELAVLVAHGLNVTRSFFYWPDFQPAPDTIDDGAVAKYRQFLQASEEVGIATIPTFIVGHMSGWNWEPSWRDGRDYYADGFMLGQQAFFIREMVRRITPSPAIAGWLISNEMPLLGGPTSREYARAWSLISVDAVRAGGSDLPVSLGDGVWTKEITGADNGFRLRDQGDVVDFFGPHSYPMGTDQTRQLSRAAFICEAAQLGKPVVLEEFGVTDTFAAPDQAAHYYRHCLHQTLLAGATGWIAWNNTDFALDTAEPYSSHLYELTFGVTTVTGAPKPTLLELQDFAGLLRRTDAAGLSRTPTNTAVLYPAHADVDVPVLNREHEQDLPVMADVTQHAWIAARAADLSPAIAREADGLPEADLLIIPSNKALLGATWPALLERAQAGAHVYVSWFAGVNEHQRGAWWPALEPLFGVRHRLRYGLAEIAEPVVTWTLRLPLGDLVPGTELSFAAAGQEYARAYLPLETTTAEVLAVDQRGEPALVRNRTGRGAVYLSAYPLEYFGAKRRDAHADDQVWRLYAALAAEAGIRPAVRVEGAQVFTDQMVHADGTLYTWLVSTSPDEVTVTPQVAAGGKLTDVAHGEVVPDTLTLPPFGVRVLRHASR